MTWTNDTIKELVEQQSAWLVESESNCLSISNDEGIDTFLYVGDQQIIVETTLFPLAKVKDTTALNDLILRTHQLQPLTTIGVKTFNGEDYYIAFGALSADSKGSVVIEEIDMLFANIGDFLELYGEYLAQEAA